MLAIIPCLGNSQDSLDYYFDDGGLSEINNEISIDITQLLDLTIAIKYEHILGDLLSLNIGVAYSFGKFIPNNIAIANSVYSSVSNGGQNIYSFSQILPSNIGGELWAGISLTKDHNRKNILNTYFGYCYYGNSDEYLSANFMGLSYGRRLINKARFFLNFEVQSRFYFNLKSNEDISGAEMTIGYGIIAGYKF